jgi:hypothetical protein
MVFQADFSVLFFTIKMLSVFIICPIHAIKFYADSITYLLAAVALITTRVGTNNHGSNFSVI